MYMYVNKYVQLAQVVTAFEVLQLTYGRALHSVKLN